MGKRSKHTSKKGSGKSSKIHKRRRKDEDADSQEDPLDVALKKNGAIENVQGGDELVSNSISSVSSHGSHESEGVTHSSESSSRSEESGSSSSSSDSGRSSNSQKSSVSGSASASQSSEEEENNDRDDEKEKKKKKKQHSVPSKKRDVKKKKSIPSTNDTGITTDASAPPPPSSKKSSNLKKSNVHTAKKIAPQPTKKKNQKNVEAKVAGISHGAVATEPSPTKSTKHPINDSQENVNESAENPESDMPTNVAPVDNDADAVEPLVEQNQNGKKKRGVASGTMKRRKVIAGNPRPFLKDCQLLKRLNSDEIKDMNLKQCNEVKALFKRLINDVPITNRIESQRSVKGKQSGKRTRKRENLYLRVLMAAIQPRVLKYVKEYRHEIEELQASTKEAVEQLAQEEAEELELKKRLDEEIAAEGGDESDESDGGGGGDDDNQQNTDNELPTTNALQTEDDGNIEIALPQSTSDAD